METVTEEVWEFAIKSTTIPILIFTSMLHQRFKKYRFLESTLELLQQFYLQSESNAHNYKVFPGDLSKLCLKCLCCGKRITPSETLGKFLFIAPKAFSHHWKYCRQNLLSMIHLQFLKTCQSFLPWWEIIQYQKNGLKSQHAKQLRMTRGFYCSQKIVVPVMIIGLGNILFVRQ